jgi:hypothetical protein
VRGAALPGRVRLPRGPARIGASEAADGTRTHGHGKPATPAPHRLAAIYERNRQPDPRAFLGPWALPLTIMSNVLGNFGGGPGRVRIHGRAGASLLDPLGSAASHGCIRVLDRDVSWIAANVPPGTPVRIKW